jgi:CheY-like chemotaxis protein
MTLSTAILVIDDCPDIREILSLQLKDGPWFTSQARKENRDLPIFLMSGGSKYDLKTLLEAGATDLFQKPFLLYSIIPSIKSSLVKMREIA